MASHSASSSPVVRAGIYTRISWDPAGQRAGVERQRLDCEALCRTRGWEVAQYLEDNDRSAYSGKPRRAYQEVLRVIDAGELDAIVTGTTTGSTAHRRSWRPSSTWSNALGSGWRS